jgi:hypothetical protein
MVTMVAGSLSNWDAYEPATLPRCDLLWKNDQDDAMRYIEERDIDKSRAGELGAAALKIPGFTRATVIPFLARDSAVTKALGP